MRSTCTALRAGFSHTVCACAVLGAVVALKLSEWIEPCKRSVKENPRLKMLIIHHCSITQSCDCMLGFPVCREGQRQSRCIWGLFVSHYCTHTLAFFMYLCVHGNESLWRYGAPMLTLNWRTWVSEISNSTHPPMQHPLLHTAVLKIHLTCMWRRNIPLGKTKEDAALLLIKAM